MGLALVARFPAELTVRVDCFLALKTVDHGRLSFEEVSLLDPTVLEGSPTCFSDLLGETFPWAS